LGASRVGLVVGLTALAMVWAVPAASAASASAGQLYTFGNNGDGQLGNATNNGTSTANPTPVLAALPGASGPVVQVAAGASYSLAVTSTGQLYAFGYNYWGQLGSTTNNTTGNPNPMPALVSLPGATGPVVQAAAGAGHSLVVTSTGQLYAFGDNYYGELGNATNDTTSNANPMPALVSLPGATGPVVQAAAGEAYSLVVTSTGQLYAFGYNGLGQLGSATNNGTANPNPTPTLVSLPGATGPVVQAAGGEDHSLVVTSTGQLYAFGDNYFGQLGNATNNATSNPNPTPALVSLPGASGPVVQAATGVRYSLAMTSTGQLYAFGNNADGELGNATNNGTSTANPTPALVSLPGATGPVVQADAGSGHSLAVTSTGQLYAFGNNYYGQLGSTTNNATSNPNPTPALVSVAGGATIDTVAIGPVAQHSLAVIADLGVSTASLPGGTVGSPYSATAHATGGSTPYTWVASGLPPGLQINSSTGQITGTPTSAGSYTTTLTVTDHDGITATRSAAVTVATPSTIGTPPTIGAPKLTGLRVAPRTFTLTGRRVNGHCVKQTAKTKNHPKCTRPIKLHISYKLTAAASVKFMLKLLAPGREVKGRCVTPTAKNARHKHCIRRQSVHGSITTSAKAGSDSFTFTGKIGGHKLAPGAYQLTATPTGGTSRTADFAIKR
jgi:alpha-tubulin suppressor-like RCC1 family protein